MLAAGEHVNLRRLRPADLAAFLAYRADPEVAQFQGWSAMEEAKALKFLSAMEQIELPKIGDWSQIAIADPESDGLIGDIGVHVPHNQSEVELGITLSRAAQGKSQGFEAVGLIVDWVFAHTSAPKIVAITDERNTGAQALLTRLGWPYVATLGPEVEIEGLTELVYEYARP
jgi:aminoglycoside 6'-N-acetyltransferase